MLCDLCYDMQPLRVPEQKYYGRKLLGDLHFPHGALRLIKQEKQGYKMPPELIKGAAGAGDVACCRYLSRHLRDSNMNECLNVRGKLLLWRVRLLVTYPVLPDLQPFLQ